MNNRWKNVKNNLPQSDVEVEKSTLNKVVTLTKEKGKLVGSVQFRNKVKV